MWCNAKKGRNFKELCHLMNLDMSFTEKLDSFTKDNKCNLSRTINLCGGEKFQTCSKVTINIAI